MVREFDERNMARSRERCAAMAERAGRRKHVLTERERRILDMWPRFEDGQPVMVGDEAVDGESERFTVLHVEAAHRRWVLKGAGGQGSRLVVKPWERVKRPVQSVLDADGVEIKVGDSMYVANNGDGPYTVCNIDENIDRIELFWHTNRNERLFIQADRITHIAPDSWERLEEDAEKFECEYFGINGLTMRGCRTCPKYDPDACCDQTVRLDIIRRAKALAGVGADE